MDVIRGLGPVATLVTTGLMAGVYLAFAISVLPGLRRTSDATFVAAMRAMNTAILNLVFAVVFAGPLLLGLLTVVLRLPAGERDGLGWSLLALLLYAGTLVVTAVVNVPLNNRLEALADPHEARQVFERRWVTWNVVRTVLGVGSFLTLVPALR